MDCDWFGRQPLPVLGCCRFDKQVPASRCGGFERLGTDAADMAVTASGATLAIKSSVEWHDLLPEAF